MKDKWLLLVFLFAIFVTYTVDRALLGLLAVPIQKELGLTNSQIGVLSAAVFWTYSACVTFSGLAGDLFNRAKIIGFAAVAWSAMAIFAGCATGFWSLFVLFSIAICAPQTLYGPSANALVAEYHKETRTIALSIHQAAYYTGWFLSGVVVAAVLAWFGSWRAAFFVCGTAGLVFGTAFLVWQRCGGLKGGGAKTAQAAVAQAAAAAEKPTLKKSILAFFGCRTALLTSVCYVTQVAVGYGYSVWGPKFVAQKFNISPAQAGTGVMFWHYAAAFAAIVAAGFVTDRLVKRNPRFRMFLSAGAVVGTIPALVLFGVSDVLWVVWASAAFLGAMIGVIGANQFTMVFDVVPSAYRSGSVGFLNVMAGLIGSLAPIMLGNLSQSYGIPGFEKGFAAMAGVEVFALVTLLAAAVFTYNRDVIKEAWT